jgi:acyl carrier protein
MDTGGWTVATNAELVREFIVEKLLFGQNRDDLLDTTSLTGSGILDSTAVLELVGFIEETFGIEVADDELVPQNLDSIEGIASFVARKKAH